MDFHNLQDIKISDKVETIGGGAFMGCHKFTNIWVPNSVRKLGSGSFAYCKRLEKVRLSKNLQEISKELFVNCKNLKSVTIPKSVKRIRAGAFSETGIETITVPSNVNDFVKSRFNQGIFDGFNKKAVIEVPKSKLTKYHQMFHKSGLSKKVKVKAYK